MNDDDVLKYWIQPEILFGVQAMGIDLTGDTPVIFEGGRGTGKTMLLKWLSNEIRIKEYISEKGTGQGFLNQTLFVGIYHRFDGPSLGSFDSRHTTPEGWETLFKHYFELTIAQKIVMMWQNLKQNGCINIKQDKEREIISEILKLVNDTIVIQEELTLDFAVDFFQRELEKVFDFINCADFLLKLSSLDMLSGQENLFLVSPSFCKKIFQNFIKRDLSYCLTNTKISNTTNKKSLTHWSNTLVNLVTFRIGTRLKGFKTFDTLDVGEFLMEDADYRRIRFEDVLMSHNEEYRNLLKKIAKKRLEHIPELQTKGFIDIENILGELPVEDEANLIVFNKKLTQLEIDEYPIEQYFKAKHVIEIAKVLSEKYRLSDSLDTDLDCLIGKKPLLEMLIYCCFGETTRLMSLQQCIPLSSMEKEIKLNLKNTPTCTTRTNYPYSSNLLASTSPSKNNMPALAFIACYLQAYTHFPGVMLSKL